MPSMPKKMPMMKAGGKTKGFKSPSTAPAKGSKPVPPKKGNFKKKSGGTTKGYK